ncbi:MAG: Rossmann-like and DUF2520 domain-containing protein [Desulfatitalea sp.]
MRIGFIGAGKVATVFGQYLRGHGVAVSGYYDRHAEKIVHASSATGGQACRDAAEVAAISDMILITTRDDQIQGVCDALGRQGAFGPHHWVGHMSGAHASLILEAASRCGAAVFSLHPLQAFAQEEKALADLARTWFSLEGDDPRLARIEELLARTGNRCLRIGPQGKPLYHLAACVFSNYLVTLMAHGMAALAQSGIQPLEGFQAMRPLIEGTIANIARLGPAKALTGPIARGDVSTVRHHREALETTHLDALEDLYTFMGLKTLDLAVQDVLKDQDKADAVRKVLENIK